MPSSDNAKAQDPRSQLEDAEHAAAAEQPKNFRDDAVKEKRVEVAPIKQDDSAIKGLDPK